MSDADRRPRRRLLPWLAVALAVLAGATLLFLWIPDLVEDELEQQLSAAGAGAPKLEVETLGPFYASVSALEFDAGPATVAVDKIAADYSPLRLMQEGKADALTIHGAKVEIDLLKVRGGEEKQASLEVFPPFLDALPVDRILLENGRLLLRADGNMRAVAVNGIAESVDQHSSATVGLASDLDDLLLTFENTQGEGTIRLSGEVSPAQWLPLLDAGLGLQLPAGARLGVAPTAVDLLLHVDDRVPSRWAGTIEAPAVRYTSPGLAFEARKAVVGVTGAAASVESIFGEMDLSLRANGKSTRPETLSVRYSGPGAGGSGTVQLSLAGAELGLSPIDTLSISGGITLPGRVSAAIKAPELGRLSDALGPLLPARASGSLEGTFELSRNASSPLPYSVEAKGELTAPVLSLTFPGSGLRLDTKDLSIEAAVGTSTQVRTRQPFTLTSIQSPGYSFTGQASVAGELTDSAGEDGAPSGTHAEFVVSLQGGDMELRQSGLRFEGITGQYFLEWENGRHRLQNLQPLRMKRLAIGSLETTDLQFSIGTEGTGTALSEIRPVGDKLEGKFYGGSITLEQFEGALDDFRIQVRLRDVAAERLLKQFPQFKGSVKGPISGLLRAHVLHEGEKTTVTIYPSILTLSPGQTGFFSYPNPEDLLGSGSGMAMDMLARSLKSLTLTKLSLRLAYTDEVPIRAQLGGEPTMDNAVPVEEFNINIKGDIVELLESELLLGGGNIKVRFDPEGKL